MIFCNLNQLFERLNFRGLLLPDFKDGAGYFGMYPELNGPVLFVQIHPVFFVGKQGRVGMQQFFPEGSER